MNDCAYQELSEKYAAVCKERDELKANLNYCRNELCVHCGRYETAYAGACDGCRWRWAPDE